MLALFTPARLRALTILGGFAFLGAAANGTHRFFQYSDRDSVGRLSDERACTLARTHVSDSVRTTCTTVRVNDTTLQLRLESKDRARLTEVCFVKAARWFIIDSGPAIECPTERPFELPLVNSRSAELRLEREWAESVRERRVRRELAQLRETLADLLELSRTTTATPQPCPDTFRAKDVLALDAWLLKAGSGLPWHFLTSPELERVMEGRTTWREDPLVQLRVARPLLLLVDFSERFAPRGLTPGYASGAVVLVDWVSREVLCQASLTVEQPVDAPKANGHPDALMPDFKARIAEGLSSTVASMSGGKLALKPL